LPFDIDLIEIYDESYRFAKTLIERTAIESLISLSAIEIQLQNSSGATLPRTGLLAQNKFRLARETDMMDDSRKKDRMYLQ
jgi:hypothetical protein